MISAGREVKGVDFLIGQSQPMQITRTVNSNVQIFILNSLERGAQPYQRTGREARLLAVRVRLLFRWIFTRGATVPYIPNPVRVVLVWDKNPDLGVVPNFNDIFGALFNSGTSPAVVATDLVRLTAQSRFSIVRDWLITAPGDPGISISNTSTFNAQYHWLDEFVDLGGRRAVYDDETGSSGYGIMSSGALLLAMRQLDDTSGAGSLTPMSVELMQQGRVRLRFVDA